MIDVNPNYLNTVTRILAGHVPECEVRAFGSRVTWTAKDYSDLDLAVVGERALASDTLRRLKEAFEESDLPFRVDVLDWHAISPAFQKVIEKKYEVVQNGKKKSLGMGGEELVGALPAGWEYTTLGEACARAGGDVRTGPFGSQLHAADYVSGGIPSIMPQNIGDNRVVREGIAQVTVEDAERLNRYRVRTGDIVYSRRGDVERRALIRDAEDGWLCGTGCLRVRFGDEYVNPDYASYYFGDPKVREWIVRHAHGATMPNLNTAILSALPFVLPPLPEQRAIAHILGTLDDKIELNRRMNETLEAMARALFKSWFVDFDPVRAKADGRDPGLAKPLADLFPDRLVDSELGEIPEGWPARPLGEVLTESTERVGNAEVAEYSSTNEGLQPRPDRFTKRLAQSNANNKLIRNGYLVFGLSRRVLNFGLMRDEIGSVSAAYRVFVIDRTAIEPDLLERMMRIRLNYFYAAVSASSREGQSVSTEGLGILRIVQPSAAVQRAYYHATEGVLGRSKLLQVESGTLAAMRDALLPELISGRLRVKDAKRSIERTV